MAEELKPARLSDAPASGSNRLSAAAWILGLLVVAAALAALAWRLPLEARLGEVTRRARGLGAWGPVAYGLLQAAALVLPGPAWPWTVAAGALFGVAVGTAVASLASTAAAAASFLIARYLARDAVARRLGRDPRFAAVDRAIAERGWLVVALLRLSPLAPFHLQNYLYGVTAIDFRAYVLTSWLAMLPGTLMYAWLGAAGRAGLEAASGAGGLAREPAEWAFLVVSLAATVAVTVVVSRLALRAVREASAPGVEEGSHESARNP